MGKKDPRVDAYIAKARPFAQPILKRLRRVIHSASPDIVETIKWGSPSYEYEGILCGFAAFKEHATFSFWKHSLVLEKGEDKWNEAMGSFGRLASVADLPPESRLKACIRKAMELNEKGVPAPHMVNRKKRRALPVPKDLQAALAHDAKARTTWDAFSPSHRREYIEWITEARTDETRERRLDQTVEWIAVGKRRNWKYEKK